jgi:hypothetical protein
MDEPVGAVAWFYESQRNSCVEMLKSFRKHNPNSSVVIISDGYVTNVTDICVEYNCDLQLYHKRHGYPASKNFEIPKEYLYRFFVSSLCIKEKYFINLEPDCLVTNELKVKSDHNYDIIGYIDPMWLYYFYDIDDRHRCKIISDVFQYYKKCGFGDGGTFHGGRSTYFDRIVGGGGFLVKTDYAKFIINNWSQYDKHYNEIVKILEFPIKNVDQFLIFQDYLLSICLPLNNHTYKRIEEYGECIIHPYKKYYV